MTRINQGSAAIPGLRREIRVALDPRRAELLFDCDWYEAKYPDVLESSMDGWVHFVVHGDEEMRAPGPGFDPSFYSQNYMPLEGAKPFTYYTLHGRGAGHIPKRLDVTAAESAAKMRDLIAGVRNPVLLVGNDAQRAGAPLLLLGLAARLRELGWSPIFLLRRAGPLFARFTANGPTLIAADGWHLAAMGTSIPRWTPILANTGWGGQLVSELGVSARSLILVHEMPAYLTEHGLLDVLERAHTVVASMPSTTAQLDPVLRFVAHVQTIVPGVHPPAGSRRGARRVRRQLSEQFGPGCTVYISAGFADHRKGFDLFLEAARSIGAADPTAVFIWLGELSAWAAGLAATAVAEGMRLLLPGFDPAPADWYQAADVYLLTSRQDPGPTTVVDAACVGVPFVGLETDIGLRALDEVVTRTGQFVPDVEALAGRAREVARTETATSRRARGAFGRAYRSFDQYVDEVIEVLGEVRGGSMRLSRAQRLFARAQLATAGRLESPRLRQLLLRGFALPWRVRRRARRAARSVPSPRRERLASVAVAQGSEVSEAEALQVDAAAVEGLRAGDRAWLARPDLLTHVGTKGDLHLVRQPGVPPWDLLRDVEGAGEHIQRVQQYSAATPPRWVANASRPPRPRTAVSAKLPPRDAVWFAPSEAVRLPRPVGVFVHAYYLDIAELLARRLELVQHPTTVYVSTDTEQKARQLGTIFPGATVRVFPNRGSDVYPKLFGFAPEHTHHDVVLHLHTKRSAHSSDLVDWLPFLLDCLLPSSGGVNAILAAFAGVPQLGMVSPSHFPSLGAATNWGPNRAIAEVLTWGRGWPRIPDNGQLIFPAGSMFWARSSALVPLQELEIPLAAFADSSAPDGTVAHAVERLLGVSCAAAGLQQLVVGRADGTGGLTLDELKRRHRFRA